MTIGTRQIEVDVATADALETRAAECGMTVAEFLAEIAQSETRSSSFEAMRAEGRGPWSPAVLAEDARRLADYERTREGIPWSEVSAWMRSWGTANELPPPKPRKL